MAAPLAIMVSPTGARRTKVDHAGLPMTPAEIARSVAESAAAGASMVHLHVRDSSGRHTIAPDAYREALAAIEAECGNDRILIQVTTEQAGIFKPAEQMAAVHELRPPAVSIALNELIPEPAAESAASSFTDWMENERIAQQWILYSPDELRRWLELRERDVIAVGAGTSLLFVLGRYAPGEQSDPRALLGFLAELGDDTTPWMVCAFGGRECAAMLAAAAFGGHARVGFENNLLLADGSLASSPAALVGQCAQAVPLTGRSVATVAEARAIFFAR